MKKVVSIKLDPVIVDLLDNVWRELGYTSRSQFIREAIVYYMLLVRAAKRDNICVCKCDGSDKPRRLDDFVAYLATNG